MGTVKELKADVVCIGGGACSLSAALTAARGNASVIVLEKQSEFGGMTNWAEGMFAVESRWQRKMKLPYTVEERFKIHMESTHWEANPRLVRTFMEKTAGTIEWLEGLGCEFEGVVAHYPGGPFVWHVFKHTFGVTEAPGRLLVSTLVGKLKELKNVQLLLNTRVKSIVREGGKITGVIAEDHEGNAVKITCKAVVCGTGGYGDRKEWVEKYCKAGKHIKTFMNAQQTGDAIEMAWNVGAAADGMGVMQAFTFMPDEMVNTELMAASLQPNLWINEQGDRFCDESIVATFPEISNQLSRQPNARALNIMDAKMIRRLKNEGLQFTLGEYLEPGSKLKNIDAELERGVKENKVIRADSINELAEKLGIGVKRLQATIDEYNACCAGNRDFLFAKDYRFLNPVQEGPFYALKLAIIVGITEGGIKINHKAEVIDNDYNVIPGLYAGGCAAGGMVGEAYIIITSGGSLSFAVNSGRMAGESILGYLGM